MNQRDQIEDEKQAEALADLPLTGEAGEDAKAGSGAGKVSMYDSHFVAK